MAKEREETTPEDEPPAYEGWQAHVEHGVREMKARGATDGEVKAAVAGALKSS